MKKENNSEINWEKIKSGTWFKAVIDGVKSIGRIQKTKDVGIFLCQNEVSGRRCKNKFGFAYSWTILDGTEENLRKCGHVRDIKFLKEKPAGYCHILINKEHPIIFSKGFIIHNGTKFSNERVRKIEKMLVDRKTEKGLPEAFELEEFSYTISIGIKEVKIGCQYVSNKVLREIVSNLKD